MTQSVGYSWLLGILLITLGVDLRAPADSEEKNVHSPTFIRAIPYEDEIPGPFLIDDKRDCLYAHGRKRFTTFSLSSGKLLTDERGDHFVAYGMKSHSELSLLAWAGGPRVYIWDCNNGKVMRSFEHRYPGGCSVSFLTRKRLLTIGSDDDKAGRPTQAKIWDLNSGALLSAYYIPSDFAMSRLSPDGGTLACLNHCSICILDPETGKRIRVIEDPLTDPPGHLIYTRDGTYLISARWDDSIYIWKVKSGELVHQFKCSFEAMRRFDLRTERAYQKRRNEFEIPTGTRWVYASRISSLAASPTGKWLAAGADKGVVFLWDLHTKKEVAAWKVDDKESPSTLLFTQDGKYILTPVPGAIKVWRLPE